ncbi:hypothetical protein ADT71_04715 [Novosphingobium sp. ST904]|nr:hypothetical protein ADT71_04715 [Novosphingobium sp. ST904]
MADHSADFVHRLQKGFRRDLRLETIRRGPAAASSRVIELPDFNRAFFEAIQQAGIDAHSAKILAK